jgi:hypothetical protein
LLEQGFVGVHVGSAARLEPIKAGLRGRALPSVPDAPDSPELEARPSWGHWSLLAGLVLGFYVCCAWASSGWGSG